MTYNRISNSISECNICPWRSDHNWQSDGCPCNWLEWKCLKRSNQINILPFISIECWIIAIVYSPSMLIFSEWYDSLYSLRAEHLYEPASADETSLMVNWLKPGNEQRCARAWVVNHFVLLVQLNLDYTCNLNSIAWI